MSDSKDENGLTGCANGEMELKESEEEQLEEFIPTPPDGGYGWVIMMASVMLNIVVDGFGFTFGVFLPTFIEYFDTTKAKASLAGALLAGVYLLTGVIAGPLTNQFGSRPVAIVGSVISTVAFVSCTFCSDIGSFIFVCGVVAGFGFGLMYLPAVVSVAFYFEKKRALATGIAVCGSGVGTFVFAPLTNYLLSQYDWKNALIILSGLALNGIVFGALLRPLVPTKSCSSNSKFFACCREKKEKSSVVESRALLNPPAESSTSKPESRHPATTNQRDTQTEQSSSRVEDKQDVKVFVSTPHFLKRRTSTAKLEIPSNVHLFLSTTDVQTKNTFEVRAADGTAGIIDKTDFARPLFKKDIFLSTTALPISNKPIITSKPDIRSYVASIASMPDAEEGSCRYCPLPRAARDTIRTMLDFSLLKIPAYRVVLIGNLLGMSGLYPPFLFLVDHALDMGITASSASFLISIVGIANTIGRMACGVLADHPKVDALLVTNIALGVGGASQIVMPYITGYAVLGVAAAVFGLSLAAYISLTSIVLVDIVGIDRLTNSFGILTMVRGISACLAPPLLGLLSDMTGDYTSLFIVSGAMYAVGGLVMSVLYLPSFRGQRRIQREDVGDAPSLPSLV